MRYHVITFLPDQAQREIVHTEADEDSPYEALFQAIRADDRFTTKPSGDGPEIRLRSDAEIYEFLYKRSNYQARVFDSTMCSMPVIAPWDKLREKQVFAEDLRMAIRVLQKIAKPWPKIVELLPNYLGSAASLEGLLAIYENAAAGIGAEIAEIKQQHDAILAQARKDRLVKPKQPAKPLKKPVTSYVEENEEEIEEEDDEEEEEDEI